MENIKVLILSMTCGEGHNAIANSLKEQFNNFNINCEIHQILGYNKKLVKYENNRFLWACKHIPHIYDYAWNKLTLINHTKISKRFAKTIPYVKEIINIYKPNIIICTHVYASNIISEMIKRNVIDKNILTATILHDFCLCPYWELSNKVDYVFQPYENTTNSLLEKNFKSEQIQTFGLPIKQIFANPIITKKIDLPNKFTVLIIGGGYGIGNTLGVLKSIEKQKLDINIIVINGRNTKTYNKIEKYIKKNNIKNIMNLGFVTDIVNYYNYCDVVISRCGSSVISEILAIKKPIIVRENMILNEKITKKLLIDNKIAIGMNKLSDAPKCIKTLMNNQDLYNDLKTNSEKFSRPFASKNICEFLLNKLN